MAEGGKGSAITALVLGIVGLFTIGGFGVGSLVGLALAGAALTRPSSRAGRDVAWAALAANLMALLTLFPVGAAVFAYRASPLAFQSDNSLPVPATPTSIEEALPAPPPPPPPPPPARTTSSGTQPGPTTKGSPTGRSEAPPSVPIRVGGEIEEPRKTRHVNPVYPRDAVAARIKGVVILECTISPQGKVVHVRTLRSVPMLDDAAIEAVRQWEYTPTLLNGVPVPVIMTVTVNFKLN
jgi:TonB family protein